MQIVSHMMPDLPNMGRDRDLDGFREYFENPQFRSDGLKIYPTLVIRGTGLYELWKTGNYRNYTPEELVEVVAQVKIQNIFPGNFKFEVLILFYFARFLRWCLRGHECIAFSAIFPCHWSHRVWITGTCASWQ